MTDRQLRQYQMLLRLRDFGTAHAKRFAEGTLAAEAFGSIGNALTQLNTYAVDRLAVRRQSAKARSAARAALVNMMDAISRTARGLQEQAPGFPNTFLMPKRRSAQTVLTAARLFARDVEPRLRTGSSSMRLATPSPRTSTACCAHTSRRCKVVKRARA